MQCNGQARVKDVILTRGNSDFTGHRMAVEIECSSLQKMLSKLGSSVRSQLKFERHFTL